ncbi:MAG: metallophosphoesterase [Patescibacteria group bacterium]
MIIGIILIVGFVVVFYGSFIEPKLVTVKEYSVDIKKNESPDRIKIAAVSDPHFGPFKKYNYSQKIADTIDQQNPDLIVLLGDYIYGAGENAKYLEPILKLSGKFPLVVISGNHDYHLSEFKSSQQQDKTYVLRQMLRKYNLALLENDNQQLTINSQQFNIIGIKEIWTGEADLEKALSGINESIPSLMLCHNPDYILEANNQVDIMLSGHTHAGQIRLPLIGPLSPLPDELGRKFDTGLFRFDQTQLFITPGVGETGPRARLFNPPEVSILNVDL